MRITYTILCLSIIFNLCATQVRGQASHTFQWRFESGNGGNFFLHDARPTNNHGYVCGGLAENPKGSNIYYPVIFRVDCQGKILWSKIFNEATESPNNVNSRVLQVSETDYVLVANVGFYFTSPHQDIYLAKVGGNGQVAWTRRIGGGSNFQDVSQAAIVAQNGDLVIAGQTASHGTDAFTQNNYTDQYFLRISANGEIIWTRTVGNHNKTDRAFDIVENPDGSFVAAGSYIHTGGTFYANLLKLDAQGNLLWNRGFGEGIAPQANHAYGLLAAKDGGYLLTGSSTNLQANFSGYSDFLAVKTDAAGNPTWIRVVAGGAPNSFENASNAVEDEQGDFAIACATNSYPTSSIVGNKHVVLRLSAEGALLGTQAYNLGGSHYPRLHSDPSEAGYLLSGFSNWIEYGGDGLRFDPILIKLDHDLEAACFTEDFSAFSSIYNPAFDVDSLPGTSGMGGIVVSDLTNASNFNIFFKPVCELDGYESCSPASAVNNPLQAEAIDIYPNPAQANSPITLRWGKLPVEHVRCIDIQGRCVREYSPVPGIDNLEISLANAGIYSIQLQADGALLTKKIIVQW